jgi:ABC-type multidrug transport system ATPase subunit
MAQTDDSGTDTRPYLLGLVGTLTGRKYFLDGGRVVVGRDAAECGIVLDNTMVSRRHAVIETDSQMRVTIKDLSSRQGTFVNGEPVAERELRDGDHLGFGAAVSTFCYCGAGTDGDTMTEGTISAAVLAYGGRVEGHRELRSSPHAPRNSHKDSEQVRASTATLRVPDLPLLRIGRAVDNHIVLDAPGVSRYHAALTYQGATGPLLTDLGSTNGTFVNGEPLTAPRLLMPDDVVFLGGFLLQVDGRNVTRHDLSASRITAWQISKEVAGTTILEDVSLSIYPREFIGLMGPSGCGKTTLMGALNGLRPATTGSVYVNDLDLYANFDALRRSIGYVPQRDILHDALTVERTLYYAARLRLPAGTQPEVVWRVVDNVIETVGLQERRATQFRHLSGGQQKRLSLAIELITKPNFIFLDEPTSPLDPETTENMMTLFRQLADEGRIVVMVTHKFEKFEEMDQVALLTRGGRLAYYGPPHEALSYFGCREPGDIYRRISARDPAEISQSFLASSQHQRYVTDRIDETREIALTAERLTGGAAGAQGGVERRFAPGHWLTLTQRYLETKLRDRRNTLLLLLQAPVVALILAVVIGDSLNDAKTLFIAAVIAIWFGANNSVREIVSESAIYERERLFNLRIPSYVLSKFVVLSGMALAQCVLFVSILVAFSRLNRGDFFPLLLILYLTSLAGVATGLFFSALVGSTEKAMSVLPLILIPQLLLSGFLNPLEDVYVNLRTNKPAGVEEFRRYEGSKGVQPSPGSSEDAPAPPPDPVEKYAGLGAARYAASVIVARWSVDALAHAVSINDRQARDALASRMTVAGYKKVLGGGTASEVTAAYRRRVLVDMIVLAGFSLLFLTLTMWALKRKDLL